MFEEGRKIRVLLATAGLTQVWLINELAKHGIVTDKTEMSSVLNGVRRGKKPNQIIEKSVEILDEYNSGSPRL